VAEPVSNPREASKEILLEFGTTSTLFHTRRNHPDCGLTGDLAMKRTLRLLFLTAIMIMAVATGFTASSQKKGQVQDPVCKLWVDKSKDLSYTYKDETYYFCSATDMKSFKDNPAKYLPKK
jgi:YHS domain-containing protein